MNLNDEELSEVMADLRDEIMCINLGDNWTLPVMLQKNKPKGLVYEPFVFIQ